MKGLDMFLVTILFKSGNTLKIKMKKFELFTKDGNIDQMNYTAFRRGFHADIAQIEAVTWRKVWF